MMIIFMYTFRATITMFHSKIFWNMTLFTIFTLNI